MFRAHDARGDRLVAVKVFRVDLTPERTPDLAAELQRLVDLDLTHPVIAAPIAAGVEGSAAYLAEMYVPAESLDVALRHFGPAPFDDVIRLTTQLAGAIDFAGAVGAHHGGLHPRDVLVSTDEVRLTGFGVARALERVGLRTPVRRPYTAPERTGGGEWGRPADVYSLAAIVHELLLGRRIAGTPQQVAEGVTEIAGADREKVREAFAKALAVDPAERYPNALSFASALRDAATGPVVVPDIQPTIQTRARAEKVPGESPLDERGTAADDLDERTPPTMPGLPFDASTEEASQEPPTPPADEAAAETSATIPCSPVLQAATDDLSIRTGDPDLDFSEVAPVAPVPGQDLDPTPPTIPALHVPDAADVSGEVAHRDGDEIDARPDVGLPAGPRSRSVPGLAAMFVTGLIIGALGGYEFAARRPASDAARQGTSSVPAATPEREATEVAVEPASSSAPAATGAVPPAPAVPAAAGAAASTASAAPAPAPAPVAAAQNPGRLLVRSTPAGAQVSLDGDDRGVTPLTIRNLPYGVHALRVTRRGYAPQERRVSITKARPAPSATFALRAVRPSPAPAADAAAALIGSLAVESRPPGAAVFVNNKPMGRTPTVVPSLKAGSYAVRLEHDGYQRWSASVRVVAGRQERVTASLERAR